MEAEQILVAHRGLIAGGRRGISKNLFDRKYHGRWASGEDGERKVEVAAIGMLYSEDFGVSLSHFVHDISKMKSFASSENEFSGLRHPEEEKLRLDLLAQRSWS